MKTGNDYTEKVMEAVKGENADVLIIGGTSLTVYPAASFVNYFSGDTLVLINKTPTSADSLADLVIHGDIAEVMRLD